MADALQILCVFGIMVSAVLLCGNIGLAVDESQARGTRIVFAIFSAFAIVVFAFGIAVSSQVLDRQDDQNCQNQGGHIANGQCITGHVIDR